MGTARRLSKFSTVDGSTAYVFPTDGHVWESGQPLRGQAEAVIGANYALDMLQSQLAPLEIATERLTFNIIEDSVAAFDAARGDVKRRLYGFGRGKLWAIDSAGEEERWAYARLVAIPEFTLEPLKITWTEVQCEFDRYSHWFASEQTIVEEDITETSVDVSIDNDGDLNVGNAIIGIEANASSGFNDMTIKNLSTGDEFTIERAGASGSIFRIDCGRRLVQYASDGETFTGDYDNFTWGSKQIDFMRLAPGTNTLRVTQSSTPNATLTVSFYAAYL